MLTTEWMLHSDLEKVCFSDGDRRDRKYIGAFVELPECAFASVAHHVFRL